MQNTPPFQAPYDSLQPWAMVEGSLPAAYNDLLNMDEEFMGAYMQGLLSDQGQLPAAASNPGRVPGAMAAGPALQPSDQSTYMNQARHPYPTTTTTTTTTTSAPPSSTPPNTTAPLANPRYLLPSTSSVPLTTFLPPSLAPTTFLTTLLTTSPQAPLTAPLAPNSAPPPATNPTDTMETNQMDNNDGMESESDSDPSNPGKKRRIRTPKQQVLNKLAQQRYRERRRQRYDELQKTVDALSEQLAELQGVQRENKQLLTANAELRRHLTAQQRELAQIRQQLQASTVAAGICSAAGSAAAKWDYEALRQQLSEQVSALKVKLATQGLAEGPLRRPLELPAEVLQDIQQAVQQYCQMCMQLMCAEKPHMAGRLAAADWQALIRAPKGDLKSQWEDCLKALNLSQEQKQQLLRMKAEHVEKLSALYTERQRLNLTAMGLMLPHPLMGECCDTTPTGKLKCMQIRGQLFCIGNDLELHKVLDDIKMNLRQEQKGLVELNYLLCYRVLSTPQAARLVVAAYPCNIDALALSTVLENMLDPQELAQLTCPPAPAALPAAASGPTSPSGPSSPHPPNTLTTGSSGSCDLPGALCSPPSSTACCPPSSAALCCPTSSTACCTSGFAQPACAPQPVPPAAPLTHGLSPVGACRTLPPPAAGAGSGAQQGAGHRPCC